MDLLATWAVQTVDGCTKYHCIAAADTLPPTHMLTHTVMAAEDSTLHVEVLGRILSKETTPSLSVLDGLPHNTTLKRKVELIAKLKVCAGNMGQSLLDLAEKGGNFYNIKRDLVAKVEHNTIRHVNCAILIKEGERCPACAAHRNSLRVKLSRRRKRKQGQSYVCI